MSSFWDNFQDHLRQKTVYFFVFAGGGVIYPYFSVFFQSLGMSTIDIGILSMIPYMCSFLCAPLFSILCDSYGIHWEMFETLLIVSVACTLPMAFVSSFYLMLVVVIFASTFRSPVIPLLDSITMHHLIDKTVYGSIRLWGAISYGLLSLIGGWITTDGTTSSYHWLIYIHSICYVAATAITRKRGDADPGLPEEEELWKAREIDRVKEISIVTAQQSANNNGTSSSSHSSLSSQQSDSESSETDGSKSKSTKQTSSSSSSKKSSKKKKRDLSVIEALRVVFGEHNALLAFSIIVSLSGFGSGVIDTFLFVYLEEIGGNGLTMGLSRAITCIAEVPMFHISGYLQKKYGTWLVLSVTQLAFVIRFVYYSLLTDPWLVLPCEVLHGLTFATMWSVSCTYANMISPPECHSSIQAFLEGLHWGIGSGLGSLIGGFIYDAYGAVVLFEISGLLAFIGMLIAIATYYLAGQYEFIDEETEEEQEYLLNDENRRNINNSNSLPI